MNKPIIRVSFDYIVNARLYQIFVPQEYIVKERFFKFKLAFWLIKLVFKKESVK